MTIQSWQAAIIFAALTATSRGASCQGSRITQDRLLHYGPSFSAFYDGWVTLTQRITSPTGHKSSSSEYNAVLEINGYVDPTSGKFTDMGWSLRAFEAWSSSSEDFDSNNRREVISLSRYVYPSGEITNSDGTRDTVSENFKSWNLGLELINYLSTDKGVETTSVDYSSRFLSNPLKARSMFNDTMIPVDNWISLDGLTIPGFGFPGSGNTTVAGSEGKNTLATIFLQPQADTNMTAEISGIGTGQATFSLKNGMFSNAIGGGLVEQPCYNGPATENIQSGLTDDKGFISGLWVPYTANSGDSSTASLLMLNGTFELEFSGLMNMTASKKIVGFENDTLLPIFTESGGSSMGAPILGVGIVIAICSWFIV